MLQQFFDIQKATTLFSLWKNSDNVTNKQNRENKHFFLIDSLLVLFPQKKKIQIYLISFNISPKTLNHFCLFVFVPPAPMHFLCNSFVLHFTARVRFAIFPIRCRNSLCVWMWQNIYGSRLDSNLRVTQLDRRLRARKPSVGHAAKDSFFLDQTNKNFFFIAQRLIQHWAHRGKCWHAFEMVFMVGRLLSRAQYFFPIIQFFALACFFMLLSHSL